MNNVLIVYGKVFVCRPTRQGSEAVVLTLREIVFCLGRPPSGVRVGYKSLLRRRSGTRVTGDIKSFSKGWGTLKNLGTSSIQLDIFLGSSEDLRSYG